MPIADGYIWISEVNMVWDIKKKVFKNLFQNTGDWFGRFTPFNRTHFAAISSNQAMLRIYSTMNFDTYFKELFISDVGGIDIITNDKNFFALTFGYNHYSILFIDINNGNKKCFFTKNSHTNLIKSVVSLGNGLFASGGEDSLIKIWDVNTCSLVRTIDNFETSLSSDQITKLVSVDGVYLASLSPNSAIKVWDLNSLTLKYRLANGVNYDLDYYKLF